MCCIHLPSESRKHRVAQWTEILLGDIRPGAVKEDIARRTNRLHVDAMSRQRAVQISRATTMERIGDDAQFRVAHGLEIYQLAEALEVGIPGIDFFKSVVACLCGGALSEFGCPRFDVARHLGERRAAVGARELQPLIFRRIVACGKVDGPVDLPAYYFVRDDWSWSCTFTEQGTDPVLAQNLRGS